MDSLTQVILGAAVGEAVLGRRLGNRAMLWGGLAGTLPDLDVLSGLVTDPMSALAYHRAFTHSLPFAVLAAPVLGLTAHRLYGKPPAPAIPAPLFYGLMALALWLLVLTGSWLMPLEVYRLPAIAAVVTLAFASMCGVVGAWVAMRGPERRGPNAGLLPWTALFFAAIVTHPLLDCFTAYGTQLLQPVTALRVAWNTVSVVDPLYTLPFLLLLILAARRGRGTRVRRRLNTAGLLVSSAYLLLTVANWFNVQAVVDGTLRDRKITATRHVHGPTLGNNLLWSATVQVAEDSFYVGQYSVLDAQRQLLPFTGLPANHDLLAPYAGDRELEILRWFTQGYYMVLPAGGGEFTLSDLRYGALGDDPLDPAAYLFTWRIDTTVRPVRVREGERPSFSGEDNPLTAIWTRLRGR